MPLLYSIDPALRLVTFAPVVLPTLEEFARALDQLASDGLFRSGFRVLVDRRFLTVEPGADYVRGAIDLLGHERFAGVRWASLTAHVASFGMGRMGEALAEDRGVAYRVFTDPAEVMDWLLEDSSEMSV
jgi:hypothetical protein